MADNINPSVNPLINPIIIIGTGLAGYSVARELRKLDKTVPLCIVTGDDGGFYSKPMLSNAFAQKKQAAQLVTQTASQMAAQLDAQILTGEQVQAIDPARKTLTTNHRELAYSKLVIAAGAQPIRLTVAGDAAERILSVNNIDDYAIFRAHVDAAGSDTPARVAILGAGLIGCEFADDLAGAGHLVTLIDPSPVPLAALAAPALSAGLHAALHARGVSMRLGTTATRVDQSDSGLRISLADGSSFDADIVLSAVGLRSDLRLAQAANLKTARGIVVDVTGQTSANDIYALGDCAEYTLDTGDTASLPYIAPLLTAARAIARTLTGQSTAIDLKPAPVMVKTPSYPLALVPPPRSATGNGRWHDATENGRTVSRFCDAQGVLLGFGLAPQEAGLRQALLAGLGSVVSVANPTENLAAASTRVLAD